MRKWSWLGAALLFFLLAPLCARAENRAVLIGCDSFLTHPDTAPSASNNVSMIARVLRGDERGYTFIRTYTDAIGSAQALRDVVQSAFGSAKPGDISFFYISTHGENPSSSSNLDATLILSDGSSEEAIDVRALGEAFAGIQGDKVIVIDACNSGAFIGKGVSGGAADSAFLGSDFKVLTSAGGSEESWYWTDGSQAGAPQGAGYFASALAGGLGLHGRYDADSNQDGAVTLRELYDHLLYTYAVSTPQAYPQNDDRFVVFSYDTALAGRKPQEAVVSDILFDSNVLTVHQTDLSFSFTVHSQTRLAYRLVYHREGKWQFDSAQMIYDTVESEDGTVSPGRKVRTLSLDNAASDTHGYVMLQFVTFAGERPLLHDSCLILVEPASGNPNLTVKTGTAFNPDIGQELAILVSHSYPCRLTVTVRNAQGDTVRRLAYRQCSRPQLLVPEGSSLYWDGRGAADEILPAGEYTVVVQTTLGGQTYTVVSEPFTLLNANG